MQSNVHRAHTRAGAWVGHGWGMGGAWVGHGWGIGGALVGHGWGMGGACGCAPLQKPEVPKCWISASGNTLFYSAVPKRGHERGQHEASRAVHITAMTMEG